MPDVVLYNGNVLTQSRPSSAQAIAVRNGRIAHVGPNAEVRAAADATTRQIDLAGRTVVPGMNDAHAHIWKIGHLLTSMLDLRRVAGLDELASRVKAFSARLPPGAWLLGRGYNEAAMTEQRAPTRTELDHAEPTRPVVLTRTCGHIYAVNSAALKKAGIAVDTAAPAGGVIDRDNRGEPTGVLRETAMGLVNKVMPPPTAADYEAMIGAALRHQLALGITSSSDWCCSRPRSSFN
jgi:predicted amidohydrolase YtcJ